MLELKSFDDLQISDYIELPDMGSLIQFPFFDKCDLDACYKNTNSELKALIDKVPLRNNRKYVWVTSIVQYLTPNVVSVPRAAWHFDNGGFEEDDQCFTHLMISECSAMTEFSANRIEVLQLNPEGRYADIEIFMNKNQFMFQPKTCPANKFVTFSGFHPHRCTRPKQHEFRYMLRVMETNYIEPASFNVSPNSYVYEDNNDLTTIDNSYVASNLTRRLKSIEKQDGKIIIHNY